MKKERGKVTFFLQKKELGRKIREATCMLISKVRKGSRFNEFNILNEFYNNFYLNEFNIPHFPFGSGRGVCLEQQQGIATSK